MTPKEKALELYNNYRNELPVMSSNIRAKKCALIAIHNEIKSIMWLNTLCINDNYMKDHFNLKIKELQEVEQEIEMI